MWYQKCLTLPARKRGFHLITDEIEQQLPELSKLSVGLLHLFIQHTSASLTINENADPTVRHDMEQHFNRFVPERAPYYQHDYEGDDDMPSHYSNLSGAFSVRHLAGDLLRRASRSWWTTAYNGHTLWGIKNKPSK
ncbi:hypothetical protein XM79_c12599 [Vibrio vulnificus]|nr:hypothetical protein XM78_c12600 [Vibrio vulnificus]OQK64133.1 hypothetical protein XM79_c12599 [Vibrio vulnificus]